MQINMNSMKTIFFLFNEIQFFWKIEIYFFYPNKYEFLLNIYLYIQK